MEIFGNNSQNIILENSQQSIKETNASLIFQKIAKHSGISRIQLVKETGLSASTVSVLTDELIRRDLILQTGTKETGTSGRKPIGLVINRDGFQIAAFSFRQEGMLYTLFNLGLDPLEQRYRPYDPDMVNAKQIEERTERKRIDERQLAGQFRKLLESSEKLDGSKLMAITISFPGNWEGDHYTSSPLGWSFGNAFVDMIRAEHGNIPVLIGDDTVFMARAERMLSGKADPNALYVYTGTGVGGAIVLNGKFYLGTNCQAGEIGHVSVDMYGRKCSCGGRGCLERYVRTSDLLGTVREAIESGKKTSVLDYCGNDTGKLTMAALGKALDAGDPLISELLRDMARKIIYAVQNMFCALGAVNIYLGGDVVELGDQFLSMLEEAKDHCGFRRVLSRHPVTYIRTPDDGDCLGSAAEFILNYLVFTQSKI